VAAELLRSPTRAWTSPNRIVSLWAGLGTCELAFRFGAYRAACVSVLMRVVGLKIWFKPGSQLAPCMPTSLLLLVRCIYLDMIDIDIYVHLSRYFIPRQMGHCGVVRPVLR